MVDNPFQYIKPTDAQVDDMKVISELCSLLWEQMNARIPASAERTLAVRKLQETRMWANAAIVLNGDAVRQG